MKKDDLQNIYGEVPAGFHHSVMNALCHLDEKAEVKHRSNKKVLKVVLVCALISAIGVATVASASGLYGLFSKPVGKYGVDIATEESASAENMSTINYQAKIVPGYLPEGFQGWSGGGTAEYHLNGNIFSDCWYIEARAYEAKDYHETTKYVVNSEEMVFNGHKAVIMEQKFSENNDHIRYLVREFFEEEGIVVCCRFIGEKEGQYFAPDRDEILRVMEHLDIEIMDHVPDYGSNDYVETAVSQYDTHDLIRDGRFEKAEIGKEYTAAVSDIGKEESKLTVKTVSITKKDSADGWTRKDFFSAGEGRDVYDKFFDENGKLKSEYTVIEPESAGDGIRSLGTTKEKTYHRKFYQAKVKVTAESDIEDVFAVLWCDAFGIEDGSGDLYYGSHNGCIEVVGGIGWDDTLSLKAGESAEITCAIMADAETGDEGRFMIKTANDSKQEGYAYLFDLVSEE